MISCPPGASNLMWKTETSEQNRGISTGSLWLLYILKKLQINMQPDIQFSSHPYSSSYLPVGCEHPPGKEEQLHLVSDQIWTFDSYPPLQGRQWVLSRTMCNLAMEANTRTQDRAVSTVSWSSLSLCHGVCALLPKSFWKGRDHRTRTWVQENLVP